MNAHRLITTLALGGALALAAGCISYQQHTTLEDDGSGRIVIDTWVPYLGLEEEAATDEELAPTISEEMGPAFADLAGVRIEENWVKVESEGEERLEHTRLVLAFDDVAKLNGHGAFTNQKITFQKDGDEFLFKQQIIKERTEEPAESTPETEELARVLFEGYTFTYTLVMPGRVVASNGTVADDGRTVTWEWPLYELAHLDEIEMTATSREE